MTLADFAEVICYNQEVVLYHHPGIYRRVYVTCILDVQELILGYENYEVMVVDAEQGSLNIGIKEVKNDA